MNLNADFIAELELLNMFNLDNSQEGIKIHHEASAASIAAGERMFEKGMITLSDGGYLTSRGHEAAEHAQALVSILLP